MSMSLDGFIAGPNERPDNGLGDGGERLHEWFFAEAAQRREGVNGGGIDEGMSTGAGVAGRGAVAPAGGWGGDHHDGGPVFILPPRAPRTDHGRGPRAPPGTAAPRPL